MAKRKRSKRPQNVIVHLPPPAAPVRRRNPDPGLVGAALINPARDRSGRFLPRRGAKRRSNPFAGGAELAGLGALNPSRPGRPVITYVGAPLRPRRVRRRSNPIMIGGQTLTLRGVAPIAFGSGLGVIGVSLSSKYLAPRMRPAVQGAIEIGAGLAGAMALQKVVKGSGIWFGAFLVGTGLSRILLPLLPWGDELDAIPEDIGDVEFIGDGLGDLGDDGIEDVMIRSDRAPFLADGMGLLPPMPIPMPPGPLMGMLRRRRLLWLLRMRLPHEQLQQIMESPPLERRRALRELRRLYMLKRGEIADQGAPKWAAHPAVVRHPIHRIRRGGVARGGKVHRVAPPTGGHGKYGDAAVNY